MEAADGGERVRGAADGADDGPVAGAGGDRGGEVRPVEAADADRRTRRGGDHRGHRRETERRVGDFLGGRRVDRAHADVVRPDRGRGGELRGIVRGEADEPQRREAAAHLGHGHVALPDMDAVRPRGGGDRRVVVHDEKRARAARDGPQVARRAEDVLRRGALHPELDDPDAGLDRRLRAPDVAGDGVGEDEVEPEAVFERRRRDGGRRGAHAPRSFATSSATLRPLLIIPPKIGPMRKPPWTLFAAMPDA